MLLDLTRAQKNKDKIRLQKDSLFSQHNKMHFKVLSETFFDAKFLNCNY
jgi:hypothetical protein